MCEVVLGSMYESAVLNTGVIGVLAQTFYQSWLVNISNKALRSNHTHTVIFKDNTDSLKNINDNTLNHSHLLYLTLLTEPVWLVSYSAHK